MWTKKETALTACLQMSIAGLHSVICISLLRIKEARLLANRIKDPGKMAYYILRNLMQNTSKAAFFVAANEFQTKLIGGGKMTRYSAFKKPPTM